MIDRGERLRWRRPRCWELPSTVRRSVLAATVREWSGRHHTARREERRPPSEAPGGGRGQGGAVYGRSGVGSARDAGAGGSDASSAVSEEKKFVQTVFLT